VIEKFQMMSSILYNITIMVARRPRMDIVDLSEKGWVTPQSSKALRSRVEVLLPMEEIGEHTTGERE